MVGNNLERDIAGGQRFGLISVWLIKLPQQNASRRAGSSGLHDQEPSELLGVLDRLENGKAHGEPAARAHPFAPLPVMLYCRVDSRTLIVQHKPWLAQ